MTARDGSEGREGIDFLAIGGGSAGYNGAAEAARLGLRTAVVDDADELGGLCILRGCMPSKTLIESANRQLAAREAVRFGLRQEVGRPDVAAVIARKRRLVGEFAADRRAQLENGPFELIRGRARFLDAHTVRVALRGGEERDVRAATVLIATGSCHRPCEVPGLAEAGFFTSDDILDMEVLPRSAIVLGGGAVALEMAHYLDGMGVAVKVLQRSPRVLSAMDDDVALCVERAMSARGIRILTGVTLVRVEREGAIKRVFFERDGRAHSVGAEEILVAMGRVPNVEALNPAVAGVLCGPSGKVLVNEAQQSRVAHIFAAGDVCADVEVVHLAVQQAELAARNAARTIRGGCAVMERLDTRTDLFAVYCQPEAAMAGLSEKSARERGRAVVTGTYSLADHGKAMVRGDTEGFVKLLAERGSGQLVGAAAVGRTATEMIHLPLALIYSRAAAHDLLRMPLYHPTMSEVWSYPAEHIKKGLHDAFPMDKENKSLQSAPA